MVAVGPCQGTSQIVQTINTSSGSSGGPIQRAMPIQKPKSLFVNLTGSETNGCGLVRLTTHRTSPCSAGFSLRGREIGGYDAALLVLLRWEEFHGGALGVWEVDVLKSYETSRSRSKSRM